MNAALHGTLLAKMAARLRGAEPRSSAESMAKAKLCLIDYLACALASRELPWSRQAIELASQCPGKINVIGTPLLTSAGDAAFANAVLGHGLVRDDMHLGSVSHLGTVIFPALLASAAGTVPSGRAFLQAVLAGYEAGAKLGRLILDVEVAKIFRPTGITGPFAAAAAVAHLRGLGEDAFGAALSLAANTAAGYNEWAATGGSEMFFHVGFAARNALTAVALAGEGAYASPSGLDGRAGQLAAFGKTAPVDTALPFDGDGEILAVFFKEVPACNFAQTAAQVARDIATHHDIVPKRIAAIEVHVPRAAALYPGCDYAGPFAHILQAKMSIHYNVAAALATGNFGETNYRPEDNPRIAALARLARVTIDDTLTAAYPARQGARVVITLNDGGRFEAQAPDVKPASNALVRERFMGAASEALGASQAGKLLAFIDALEAQSDASRLNSLLAPAAERRR